MVVRGVGCKLIVVCCVCVFVSWVKSMLEGWKASIYLRLNDTVLN